MAAGSDFVGDFDAGALEAKADDASDYSDELGDDLGHDDSEDEEEVETGLTENQGRLLYMIGLYTRPARTGEEKEEWIRRQALLVMIYEAIVAQVLDYDYAPASIFIETKRRFFNKSQEGASDLDFLREEELLNGLKLSSKSYQPVTCYQISRKGQDLVRRMPKADKDAVHELVYAPGTRELLRVEFRGEEYALVGPGGYERISTVTECEDVSYVSSAYVPQCLRFGGRPTLSNAHRAGECAVSVSNIRDELDEVITLNSVSIIVAEYIPFGANQIVTMNNNLGSTERVQGGFFTALIDDNSAGTKFEVEPGLTSVNILDYTLTKHINFEADIHLPEEEGIVQVETFGVSMNADGTIFYGMQVEAVMDRIKDHISLDHLARLLVDVAEDSSTIVDSVLSVYQRRLLHLIFGGEPEHRDKVNLIVANEITPHLTAEEYMDKGEYENELKQIIGDTRAAFDVSEHDTLVFGENGLLIAGPNSRKHEPLLCSFLQFTSMDLFVRNFWARMFRVFDTMSDLRRLINQHHRDPTRMKEVRTRLQHLSDDIRLLGEVLGYLIESLESAEIPPEPGDAAGRALYERLAIASLAGALSLRVLDLKKNMRGAETELDLLRRLAADVADDKSRDTSDLIEQNTRRLLLQNETQERIATILLLLLFIFSGLFAFSVLDRLTGSWSVMGENWFRDFAEPMILQSPMVWFLFSLFFFFAVSYGVYRLLTLWVFQSQGVLSLRIRVMQRLRPERFNLFLQSKPTALEDRSVESTNTIVRVSWVEEDSETFGGTSPTVTLTYDTETAFLHYVTIIYNRRAARKDRSLDPAQVRNRIADDLREAGVFQDPDYGFDEDVIDEEDIDDDDLGPDGDLDDDDEKM